MIAKTIKPKILNKRLNSQKKILIVEDEIPLLELLADKFISEGFNNETEYTSRIQRNYH